MPQPTARMVKTGTMGSGGLWLDAVVDTLATKHIPPVNNGDSGVVHGFE